MEKTEKFTYLKIREAKLTENKNTYAIEGYAATWINEYPVFDWVEDFGFIEFYESFERGAFAKSINARAGKDKKNSIKMLYQHNRNQVLGTPTLEEDEIGLKFYCEIAKDVSYAKDAITLIENEDLRQISIGFSENTYTIERKDNDELHLKHTEVYLHEISVVTWGANEEALITKNRSNINILKTIREFGKEKIIEVLNAMTNTVNTEKNKDKENKEEKEAMTNPQFRFTPLQKKKIII